MEEWLDISSYEGIYQVSNTGKIKILPREISNGYRSYICKEKIMKQTKNKYGYMKVSLLNKTVNIHRLVAKAFIPNPENKPEVNHKDGDKSNNNDWNLEWNTVSENTQHAYDNNLINKKGINHHMNKLNNEDVYKIRELCLNNKVSDVAKLYDVSESSISQIKNKKTWKHI